MSVTATGARRRVRLRVEGTVQGVGFRPYVYRLARELTLGGFVLNDARGVLVEAEGPAGAVEAFVERLPREAPPLAVLDHLAVEEQPARGAAGFEIHHSPRESVAPEAPVPADCATCAACLRELFDPRDRRHRYPLINCTDCGPRFTIVQGIPYDRPRTTMAPFTMCASCRAEYEDPGARRFHAQPNACPVCGPRVRLVDGAGEPLPSEPGADAVAQAARLLGEGAILAVKGLGGYHLACLAADAAAVTRLRARKHREEKPFALMAPTLQAAAALVEMGEEEASLLAGPARPIVLMVRRAGARVAGAVAPGAAELGVMLPYTPLHHLLLADLAARRAEAITLVMTSGNLSDEPIAFHDPDALTRLGRIADALLIHDRPIQTRTDDSVARVVEVAGRRRAMLLRRSRGYVPAPLALPGELSCRPILACGAELKHTLCLARGRRAWVSHHIGDLRNAETFASFLEAVEHFRALLELTPELVAHDLHPDYLSTGYARELDGVELVGVQHHHAHLAACLAEHGEAGPAVAAIFDGSGYGPDGTVWGGEILHGDLASFTRVGHLRAVRLPGAEQAIRQPWRMACAWLQAAGVSSLPRTLGEVDPVRLRAVASLATAPLMPLTSSAGRLFDAVAALCGVRQTITYEGQAAIELEAACDPRARGELPFSLCRRDGMLILDPAEAIIALSRQLAAGTSPGVLATRFHRGLARVTAEACARAAGETGTELVVLAGGVFANRRLLGGVAEALARAGLRALWPQRLPAGDGAISFGQAMVAAARDADAGAAR